MTQPSFVGVPCGHYGPSTFHKGFKFQKCGKFKVINLGEFFFVRISTQHDPCIGELQLLWNDQNTNQRLSSVRLYFLPEQTPDGRLSSHGEDEVLVASDNVVLRLDDLVSWITEEVHWNHGLLALCSDDVKNPSLPAAADVNGKSSKEEEEEDEDEEDSNHQQQASQQINAQTSDVALPSHQTEPPLVTNGEEKEDKPKSEQGVEKQNSCLQNDSDNSTHSAASLTKARDEKIDVKEEKVDGEPDDTDEKDELRVLILSYPSYCRYKSILKRVDKLADRWLKHDLVVALGGFTINSRNTHILFCRETFEHEELAHHELNCEYLAPTLKVKRRRKKGKPVRSTSPGSESNTSEESKEISVKDNGDSQNNGFKQPPCKTEQEFLQRLYKFMKKRKTPIHRVPHLGFKQIDLFVFFSFAQKLGGYDKITGKKLWKHVYDELGGDPGSTSAATCTRRHYEKLLLPFERFMDGKEYKAKPSRKQQKPQIKKTKDETSDNDASEKGSSVNGKAEDAYAFTDSNHENSKDSNEEQQSGDDTQTINDNFSDEDSKSVWSVQKAVSAKESDAERDDAKQIKPLIIQKEQNESFSEKERKWNEIRRKNALARKWVRQLRPSRGGRSASAEKVHLPDREQVPPKQIPQTDVQLTIKSDFSPLSQPESTQIPKGESPVGESVQVKHEKLDAVCANLNIKRHLQEKLGPATLSRDSRPQSHDFGEQKLSSRVTEPFINHKLPIHTKTEPLIGDKKLWCGYGADNPAYHMTPDKYAYGPSGFEMNMLRNFIKQEYKPMTKSEINGSKPFLLSNSSSESTVFSSADAESSFGDNKPNHSQRRPSVIQHTEYITSPSPSQSPKQVNPDPPLDEAPREPLLSFSSKMITAAVPHANVMGKILPEWTSKCIPVEAVACKTPAVMDKSSCNELHDRVLMPSTCKTLGPTINKVPMYVSKSKIDPQSFADIASKSVRDKATSHYRQVNIESAKRSSGFMPASNAKVSAMYQKAFHPIQTMANSSNMYYKPNVKQEQHTFSFPDKSKQYSEPFFNQPKRHRLNVVPPLAPIPPRPSLLPFSRQHTYRTSPLSDIPKAASSSSSSTSDYENAVLDLSLKKKVPEKMNEVKSIPFNSLATDQSGDDAICLDLSVKRKPNSGSSLAQDNPIENITPPLPASPKPTTVHPSYSSSRPLRPLPTLIALHDLIREETSKQKSLGSKQTNSAAGSLQQQQHSVPLSSVATPSNTATFPGSTHSKIPSNFVTLPPGTFPKEMGDSLYTTHDPSQFSPYVIPPFYGTTWSPDSNNNLSSMNPSKNSSASPSSFKEAMSHSVFPKQYLYNYKHQFHPLLCKDNSYYPPSCK